MSAVPPVIEGEAPPTEPLTNCETCNAYFALRGEVISRVIVTEELARGLSEQSSTDRLTRYVVAVHARHEAGLSLALTVIRGERLPELFVPDASGRIVPRGDL